MNISASQAAKEAGVSLSTITRAIKSGKVSATQNENGQGWLIDTAELFRVYPKKAEPTKTEAPTEPTKSSGKANARLMLEAQRKEIELLKQMNQAAQSQIEDLKADRNEWREQAQNTTRLLEAPKQEAPKRKRFLGIF